MSNLSWIRRDWVVVGVLFVLLAVLSFGVTKMNQTIDRVEEIGEKTNEIATQNDRFVDNFSNYMNCLIVNEEEVVIEVGEEAYIEICKRLLYRGIEPIPDTIKADPSILTTTTTGG